ncbi:hypothetical protein PG999_011161 [Apiospora kogelbergensis]|uniref:Uncharacterized protein n=1 Tax=Apiospora kogelbergensis TaxID=1337665 RepID=A0AAW0QDH7_9PEZI
MPDINSIPASPSATPRRTSTAQQQQPQPQTGAAPSAQSQLQSQSQSQQPTGPPTAASPELNILPSNQQTYHQRTSSTSLPSPPLPASSSNQALPMTMPPPPAPATRPDPTETGPGPIRHPRPLTAAELHQQLEQEQELLVNRLTRDLTILRAQQNSSVVSNTSSHSASASVDQTQTSFVDTHLMSGPGFPLPTTSSDRRHQRTSSSTSTRSMSHAAAAGSATGPLSAVHPGGGTSALEAARNPRSSAMSMSRQNSTTSHRSTSRNRSPNPYSRQDPEHGSFTSASGGYFPRRQISTHGSSVAATPGSELSPGLMPATLRYEETAHYRHELETAKRENENLKRRIKELEKVVREQRESDASAGGRVRSESVSTTASVGVSGAPGVSGGGTGIAGGRGRAAGGTGMERAFSSLSITGSVGVGVPEEELRVGESAASQGVGQEGKASEGAP